jgi:tetratricopeptide (TPR) repeat protein
MRGRWFVGIALLLLLVPAMYGCMARPWNVAVPPPEQVPQLEEAYRSRAGDVDVGMLLVMAYRGADRGSDARDLLETLQEDNPGESGLAFLSGVLFEDAGMFDEALAEFDRLLEGDLVPSIREDIEVRVQKLRAEAIRADVRRSLAQEAELTQGPPDPGTIGVFPFVYEGTDENWAPLALALPELLSTDLGITGRLRLVERIAVQALLDEIALNEAGRVESATAARGGRILGSRHIVQGRLRVSEDGEVSVDAALVEVLGTAPEQVDPLQGASELDRFFDLEKSLAFDLYEELGIALTPAEREAINERQTESIEALLAFGRGLAAMDAGDFGRAQEEFQAASLADPSFSLPTSEVQRSAALAASPASVMAAQAIRATTLQRTAVQELTRAPVTVQQRALKTLGQQPRSILAEVLNQDRVGRAILLELIFRVPGGAD